MISFKKDYQFFLLLILVGFSQIVWSNEMKKNQPPKNGTYTTYYGGETSIIGYSVGFQTIIQSASHKKRIKSIAYYKNGKKNGIYREFDNNRENSLIRETYYKNDKKNGVYREFDSDQHIILESHYKNDMLNGSYIEYFSDSKMQIIKMKASYKDGIIDGDTTEYNFDGSVFKVSHYSMGELKNDPHSLQEKKIYELSD